MILTSPDQARVDMSQAGGKAERRFRMAVRDSNGDSVTTPAFLVYKDWHIIVAGTGVILRKGEQVSVLDSFKMTGVYFTYGMVEVKNSGDGIIVRQAGANQPEPERNEFMTGEEGDRYFVTLTVYLRETYKSREFPPVTRLGIEGTTDEISDTGGELRLDHGQGYTIVVRLFERKECSGGGEKHMPRGSFYVDIDPR